MPPDTDGLEVELRPAGATAADASPHWHDHSHGHDHHDDHHHHHGTAADDMAPGRAAYPHVGVVARPDGAGVVHSLVYPSVTEGEYELYALPAGPVVMTASVIGGQVTRNRWPG
jgi:hypothetical protein